MNPDGVAVEAVPARDPEVVALVEELTAELDRAGYRADESFGYTVEQLEAAGVLLVGARVGGRLVGLGGLEVGPDGEGPDRDAGPVGELKRFVVAPGHRGRGVADAVLEELVARARARGVRRLRLETGDRQHAALGFYRRHGFAEIPRFGPYVDSATSVCLQRVLG